jgi:hypothetical protein
MARYQNFFTQVQVRAAADMGVALPAGSYDRSGRSRRGIAVLRFSSD